MAKITLDRGPAANFAIPAALTVIPNLTVVVVDRGGPIWVECVVQVDNVAANTPVVTLQLRKNSVVQQALAFLMPASITEQFSLRAFDAVGVVGDSWDVRIQTDSVVAGHEVEANGADLKVEALGLDAGMVAGIGPALA